MSAPVQEAGIAGLWDEVAGKVADGHRFAGLMATARPGGLLLSAHLAGADGIWIHEKRLPAAATGYPALTPRLGAAFWYERAIHDLFGVVPDGHPRLAPLLLPLAPGSAPRPAPGTPEQPGRIEPDEHAVGRHVMGAGMFTIPHGPVRSGVLESIEYLVETPGEDIPHLSTRVFYKHRGIEKRFEGLSAGRGVLLAERTEGVASVAHALAFCHAAERIAGTAVPRLAALVRVLYAELERIANHLDVAARLADAGALAVAAARFAVHRERVLRLAGRMCGSRFGRGVVVPGGVTALPRVGGTGLIAELDRIERAVSGDATVLMGTASFLDRLRGTGPLPAERAAGHGALGPVGKASGYSDDARTARPYDAYRWHTVAAAGRGRRVGAWRRAGHRGGPDTGGDVLARLRVRWDEVASSFQLLRQVAGELGEEPGGPLRAPCAPGDGRDLGWAEAPQGEVLYDLRVEDGWITRCHPRSASFHNLVLCHEVFAGDILTDFPFIEASFGLSAAGAAR